MRKIFFAILAVTLLSASSAYAGKGKHAKKQAAKTECCKHCTGTGCCKK